MAGVEFYQEATQKAVFQGVAEHLSPGTSVAIIDIEAEEIIFSTGAALKNMTTNMNRTRMMEAYNNGQTEYDLKSESGEELSTMAAFGEYANWNWIIVSFTEKNQLFRYTYDAMTFSFAVAGAFLLFVIAVVYRLSNSISGAVVTLEKGARRLANNDMDVEIDIKGDNEFSRLASSFNSMIAEIRLTQNKLTDSILDEKKTNQELQKSRKKYQDLVEGTPDLITRVDDQGRFLFVNHSATEIFGLPVENCIGRLAFDFIHPDDQARTLSDWDDWMKSGETTHYHENRQVSIYGQVHYMAWSIRAEYDEDNKVCGFASTARDITEHKQSEEERNKLQNQLNQAQKMEAVGQLAGGVAHDFNNMLGVILGHTELALIRPDPSNTFKPNLLAIQKAATHSADLTRQLLTFARKQSIDPKILSLNDCVAGMLSILQRLIGENIQLNFEPAEAPWLVKVDSSQIEQILANLCVNARDAITDVGTITISTRNISIDRERLNRHVNTVLPSELPSGEYVQLSVRDNGIGIEEEAIKHIFEPFYTTKEVGKGTGLGLATAFGAIKQNNGFVHVSSEPGQGTLFAIFLPREITAQPDQQADSHQALRRGAETILLVEDDEMLLEVETIMLEQGGYNVLAAETVSLAEALAQEHVGQIDLLLTDVVMPEMNGKDLSVKLQALCPDMKILFMSGYTADIVATQGIAGDNINFLNKPFSAAALTAKVREVLDSA